MSFLKSITSSLVDNKDISIAQINIMGSKADQTGVDFWSDTDLLIRLQPSENIDKLRTHQLLSDLGEVVGREEHRGEKTFTQRSVIYADKMIQRIDLKFCTYTHWTQLGLDKEPEQRVLYKTDTIQPAKVQNVKDSAIQIATNKDFAKLWFLLFEAIKKLMRNDNLIGLHLLLECLQEYLVLRMKERDTVYKTQIHRRGYNEQLPDSISFEKIKYKNKISILNYLKALAKEIDQEMQNADTMYASKMRIFSKYIEDCKRQVRV